MKLQLLDTEPVRERMCGTFSLAKDVWLLTDSLLPVTRVCLGSTEEPLHGN